jgi:hypothetical protein
MNSPEMRCPGCNVILKPASDRPGLLECPSCHTLYSPSLADSTVDSMALLKSIGKVILILCGLIVVGIAIVFAGCVLTLPRHP